MYDIVTRVVSLVSNFVVKDEHKILFFSTPDFSDNAKYMYDKMVELGIDERYRLIWCVYEPIDADYVIRRTLKYFSHILTAKYIISTHGTPGWKAKNQVAIELWHGLPLKNIGYFYDYPDKHSVARFSRLYRARRFSKTVDNLVVTSQFERTLFSSLLNIDPRKVVVLGQPRCDALYGRLEDGMDCLCRVLGRNDISEKHIILYLPTFREYDADASRKIVEALLANASLKQLLVTEDVLFICKPHPHDEGVFSAYNGENIHVILNEDLRRENATLYDFLNIVDVLVTDYSSIYFDYLLLDRPIIFHMPDLEEYRTKRGFILDPLEEWMPGDVSTDDSELVTALMSAIGHLEKRKEDRVRLRRLLFKHTDGRSSERVCDLVLK
jgi:CDP-glycerol glycerophosphotransferase (TagB/SpsB family)